MRAVRVFLIVFGVLALPLVVLSALAGQYRVALSALLLVAGAFLFAGWAWGYPTAFPAREWVAFLFIAAGLAVVGAYIAALLVLVVTLVLQVGIGRLVVHRLPDVEFEPVGPDDVMPKAQATVDEFEAAGFRRIGGYRVRLPLRRKMVTATVLAWPGGDRWATVTDRVWEVVSRFDERWLITTSSAIAPVPATMMRQALPRGRPAELLAAHHAALELIAARGVEPDRFSSDAEVLDVARVHEELGIRFASKLGIKSTLGIEAHRGTEDPALDEDGRSRRRVDAWLVAPAAEGAS
jgi:hypothetical protein